MKHYRKVTVVILAALILILGAGILTGCGGSKSGEKAVEGEDFEWPDSEIGRLLPETDVKALSVNFSEEAVYADLIMDSEDYKAFVDACKEKGFTKEVSMSEDDTYARYNAENDSGYVLSTTLYKDDKECHVSLLAPEDSKKSDNKKSESKDSKKQKKPESKKEKTTQTDGVTPEFKEAMDSYEEFFDEYIEVMKNYQEDPVGYLADYTKFMAQYTETMQKLEDMDTEEMSDADAAYYLEVMNRINQKLLEVQ